MADKKLRIWLITGSNDPEIYLYLREKFSAYECKNNIKIQLDLVNWERVWTAFIEAFKSNTAPDIVQLGTSWVRTFAHIGYLDKAPENIKIKPSINEGINRICRINDVQYAVPWIVDTIIMAGRKDYMSELGIDKSDVKNWEGLKKVAVMLMERRKRDSRIPKPLSVALKVERDTIQRFFSILWSRGWEFPDLEKVPEKIIMDPLVIDTIKFFADLKIICDRPEEINKHPYQINEDFYKQGLSVFYIGSWYGIVNQINSGQDEYKEKYCLLPFPSLTGKPCTYGGGTVLTVSFKSNQKEEAWKLIEYLISEDFVNRWALVSDNIPAFEGSFWQKRFSDERVKLMYEQTTNSKIYPPHPAWLAVENELVKGIGNTLLELTKKKHTEISAETYSFFQEIDQRIKVILEISREMR